MYRRRRFDAEIIELCVRWYITYRLSYRDLVAMMAERGIVVSHTTIHMLRSNRSAGRRSGAGAGKEYLEVKRAEVSQLAVTELTNF
jgi:transposase-like protein